MVFRAALARASGPLRASLRAPSSSSSSSTIASTSRLLSTSLARSADDHGHRQPAVLQGKGSAPGTTPTDLEQATGLERMELMGRMEGIDVYDMKPLDASRLGSVKEPIVVDSMYPERLAGCTGYPAGSHDTIWIKLEARRQHSRCPECGSVYKLNHTGPAHTLHAH